MSAMDHIEIRTLIDRYSHYIDRGRYADWVALFARDGEFAGGEGWHAVGHEELTKFTQRFHDTILKNYLSMQHFFTNVVVELVDDNNATASSYALVVVSEANGWRIHFTSVYDDQIIREDGAWRFRQRRITRNA